MSFVPKSPHDVDVRLENLEDPLFGGPGTIEVDLNGLADLLWPG